MVARHFLVVLVTNGLAFSFLASLSNIVKEKKENPATIETDSMLNPHKKIFIFIPGQSLFPILGVFLGLLDLKAIGLILFRGLLTASCPFGQLVY